MKKIVLFLFVILYGQGINIFDILMKLDLNSTQKSEISKIIYNCRKPIQHKNFLALSIDNYKFDKKKYIEVKTKFMEKRIKKQAEILDKIMKILDKKQIIKLKRVIDD